MFRPLLVTEAIGDTPDWMRIKSYREEGRRAELILKLGAEKRKNYWFPVSPNIFEKFKDKIQSSRYEGLTYLQEYIRRYRGYLGRWPSRRYVERNKLSAKNTLTESIGSRILSLISKGTTVEEIAESCHLPVSLVKRFVFVSGHQLTGK